MPTPSRLLIALILTIFACTTAQAQQLSAEALTVEERDAVILTMRLSGDEVDTLDEFAALATLERQEIIDTQRERIASIWRAQAEAAQRGETPDMEAAMGSIWETWSQLDATQERMLQDLAVTLGDDRTEQVERCVLRLYRMRMLASIGVGLSTLSADPLAVSHDAGVPALLDDEHAERFHAAMLAYDRAIAKLLREHDRFQRDAAATFSRDGFDDQSPEVTTYFEDMIALYAEIKETHRERCDAIVATLPLGTRSEWNNAWLRRAYPEVYERHYIETATEILLADGSKLHAEEREAIEAYAVSAQAHLGRAREKLRRAIDDAEDRITVVQMRDGTDEETEDLADARERLRRLASEGHARFLAIIAPERHRWIPPLAQQEPEASQ